MWTILCSYSDPSLAPPSRIDLPSTIFFDFQTNQFMCQNCFLMIGFGGFEFKTLKNTQNCFWMIGFVSLSLALFCSIFVGLIENENLINQTTQKSRRDGVVLGCWGYNFLFLFFISLMSGLFFFLITMSGLLDSSSCAFKENSQWGKGQTNHKMIWLVVVDNVAYDILVGFFFFFFNGCYLLVYLRLCLLPPWEKILCKK